MNRYGWRIRLYRHPRRTDQSEVPKKAVRLRRCAVIVVAALVPALLTSACAVGPSQLSATPLSGEVNLTWGNSSGIYGCQLSGQYQIEWAEGSSMPSSGVNTITTTGTTYTVGGLYDGTEYVFNVQPLGTTPTGNACTAVGTTTTATTTYPLPFSGEFADPSWTSLPAASVYNTTPSCPPTASNNWSCEVPTSALPPQDLNNPERYLNSAYWPAEKRLDIEIYAIQQYGYSYNNCSSYLPHYCFLADAEAAGYPISHTPAVGDLWVAPGECLAWADEGGALPADCSDSDTDWYIGYVEALLPNGGFIQSWGGSTTAADSGLAVTEFYGTMDPYTDFIGLMPPGSPQPG